MANIPLKTIKFPGLSDTYTIPDPTPVDATLANQGQAADAKKVGDELSDLKQDINNITGNEIIENWKSGYYATQTSVTNIDLENITPNAYYSCVYCECTEGDVFNYTGYGSASARNWAFIKANGDIIIRASANEYTNEKIIAPANAAYVIFNANIVHSKAIIKGVLVDERINNTNQEIISVSDKANNGKAIYSTVSNSYVNNTNGLFENYANWKRTDYIDIRDYEYLYFDSQYRTPYCYYYDENKTPIISFIIQVGETVLKKPDNAAYCAFSAGNSQFSTIVFHQAIYGEVKNMGIKNIHDISLKYLNRTDILTQMIKKPLFLVYTDIHAAVTNFERISEFYNKNLKTVYPLCLGDMVADQATESTDWMNTDFGKETLKVIGNHDLLVNGTLPGITELEAYNKYLKDDIASWNVVQPASADTLGLTYYYKDTTVNNITVRMIILDEYYYTEAQHNWFVSVLDDARTNNIPVIVCQHQSNVWNNQATPLNDNWAFATPELGFDLYRYDTGYSGEYGTASENRLMAVDDFIANGGEFICWMSGHTHSDQSHTFTRNDRKQLSLVFSNAGMSMTSSNRLEGYSSDCFQYVAVDTNKKYVYVLRIGEATDKWFHTNTFMCYDYGNHVVKEYH